MNWKINITVGVVGQFQKKSDSFKIYEKRFSVPKVIDVDQISNRGE